jgi:hypothetical protein
MASLAHRVQALERRDGPDRPPLDFWLDEGATLYRPRDGERLTRGRFEDYAAAAAVPPFVLRVEVVPDRADPLPADRGGGGASVGRAPTRWAV